MFIALMYNSIQLIIFPKQTKWRKGISTNRTDAEEFKQRYCMKYEQNLPIFGVKKS